MTSTATPSRRIAAIDWMRGLVMLLMVLDHVGMAYGADHLSYDSVVSYPPGLNLPDAAFWTRWISHLCAPTFVFLAGTALAMSVERKVARGAEARSIDIDILKRGAFIALLDPTLISLFSGRWTFQVLYAIGAAMMCMALFRRLSTRALLTMGLGWLFVGEALTTPFWPEDGAPGALVALSVGTHAEPGLVMKYPLLPWLSMMLLGWAFGRALLAHKNRELRWSPLQILAFSGALSTLAFVIVRGFNAYGNMLLLRVDGSFEQWMHVSKYPPSASFLLLELALLCWLLCALMLLERQFGVRQQGVLLVFGQTSMFFYLVHRVVLEGTATYLDWRDTIYLGATWGVSFAMLLALYPLCRWYRSFKKEHPEALWAKYI